MKTIIFICILFFIVQWLIKNDFTDRVHPFGGDNLKLEKYLKKRFKNPTQAIKNFSGEDYGVQTFWGKSNKKDTIKTALDKIEWLGTNYVNDVIWRRCLIYSIVLSVLTIIIIGVINISIDKIVSLIFLFYVGFYMAKSYENTHIIKIKSKFIEQNINVIKDKLNLPHNNSIKNSSIL